ncbi:MULTISPECIES: hypothetical protein [Streptomyces]|uniref:TetR family transcriptional regulator n=1 Tax=Streptomyces xanthochromogenes TaxID=67384 RepID=A0ABQ3AN39_9ACTN|nr:MULTISPECIES: hypothetical protein [Streptomyces]MYV91273.1 hypothetical protein [Streptomyces sp. SID1034]GGY62434.1 hypothetical protein GCM10010326_66650 [Streptomyces xanthochromogenes]
MTTDTDTPSEHILWESIVGPRFVEALNDGLARARSLRTLPPSEPTRSAQELPDPFVARVMASFGTALPAVLAPEEKRDVTLRSALLRRGRRMLMDSLTPGGPTAPLLVRGRADELSSRHETLVRTLLMECAALVVLEGGGFQGGGSRPADLIRALGRTARAGEEPAVGG